MVSHAAGAWRLGTDVGPPSPVAVPDIVLIAYRHTTPGPVTAESHTQDQDPGVRVGEWSRSWSTFRHERAIAEVIDNIRSGEVYVLNVVGHWQADWAGSMYTAAERVASIEGARWGGALFGPATDSGRPEWFVASGSPECFVRVTGREIRTYPIKGTAPATPAGRERLLGSVKERAEHTMVVDLLRNDMSQVCEPGSVDVERLFYLRRWGALWQAESAIVGRLRSGSVLSDVIGALCPPGSVTGTPKPRAAEVIAHLEPVGRGPAMGAMGFAASPSDVRLGLSIRTIAGDDSRLHLWAGGGITWRSIAAEEVAEATAKAEGVRSALRAADDTPG